MVGLKELTFFERCLSKCMAQEISKKSSSSAPENISSSSTLFDQSREGQSSSKKKKQNLLVCAGEEGWAGTVGVPAADWGPREAWEGDEQEMFMLQDRMALIPVASSWTLTLIDEEDDIRS
jgi:hypothetical protein